MPSTSSPRSPFRWTSNKSWDTRNTTRQRVPCLDSCHKARLGRTARTRRGDDGVGHENNGLPSGPPAHVAERQPRVLYLMCVVGKCKYFLVFGMHSQNPVVERTFPSISLRHQCLYIVFVDGIPDAFNHAKCGFDPLPLLFSSP